MELIKFSRHAFTETDAAKINDVRPEGAVTESLRDAATNALLSKLREAQFSNPKEDRILLYNRVLQMHPNLTALVVEPLMTGAYVSEIAGIEEAA